MNLTPATHRRGMKLYQRHLRTISLVLLKLFFKIILGLTKALLGEYAFSFSRVLKQIEVSMSYKQYAKTRERQSQEEKNN